MKIADTRTDLVTPEGAFLSFDIAGVGPRSMAFLIDFSIRVVIFIVLNIVLSPLGGVGTGLSAIAIFLLEWFYPVFFEVWKNGATPGKKTMGIQVINDDGTPVGFSQSLLRNLLRVVDFLPVFYMAGIVSIVFNAQFKRLGDLAAGTLVVYKNEVKMPKIVECEQPIAIPIRLTIEEQQAILSFAERQASLSVSRRQELASILMPILPKGVSSKSAPQIIVRMASTLLGR